MKNILTITIFTSIFALSGCVPFKPYAQNPFNPNAKLESNPASQNTGKVTDSTTFRAGSLGLAAASRPIPGSLPHGAGVGIATALLLGSGKSKPLVSSNNGNYLVAAMPITEANNEEEAQIKMGSLVEKAIIQSLQPLYHVKIEEYDDSFLFGRTLRPRWIRVDGPYCENWSCQISGPIPTANALQWEGEMTKHSLHAYTYRSPSNQTIGFVKISREYDKDKFLSGTHHVVEGTEIPGFDYEQFFRHISENLPDWVDYHIAISSPVAKWPYTLNKGNIKEEMKNITKQ